MVAKYLAYVPCFVFIMVLWVLIKKNPFEIPCDSKMRAKRLIIHDKEDLEVFIPLYPIPFLNSSARKPNACHKVEEINTINLLATTKCIHFVM